MNKGFSLDDLKEELNVPKLGSKYRDNGSTATNYSSEGEEEMISVALNSSNEGSERRDDLILLQSANDSDTKMDGECNILPLPSHNSHSHVPQSKSLAETGSCSISVAPSSLVSIPFSAPNTRQNSMNESPTTKIPCNQPFFRRTNPVTTSSNASDSAVEPKTENRASSAPIITEKKREGLFQSLSWDSRLADTSIQASPFRPRQPLVFLKSPKQSQPLPNLPPQNREKLAQPYLSMQNQQNQMQPNPSPQHRRDNSNNSAFMDWNVMLKNKTNNNNIFLLQSPQRIDLANPSCASEVAGHRGLNSAPQGDDKQTPLNSISKGEERALQVLSSLIHQSQLLLSEQEKENNRRHNNNNNISQAAENSKIIESLRLASKSFTDVKDSPFSHDDRCQVLDDLLLTQRYAIEMLRITESASKWMSTIGLSTILPNPLKECNPAAVFEGQSSTAASSHSRKTAFFPPSEAGSTMATTGDRSPHSPLPGALISDSAAMLARLRSAKKEMQIKDALIDQLNEELSKCREEIGRLKVTRSEERPFKSPNRSILDDDDSDNEASVCLNTTSLLLHSLTEVNESFNEEGVTSKTSQERNVENTITYPRPMTPTSRTEDRVDQLTTSCATRMINVHMLDAENFVTAWDDMGPLPPPPDHSLHAPIVHSLLEQWTSDKAMQETLLKWLEGILDCSADLCHIPPLTISSLNHQVRDGFIMHVIPLLLRRVDVHVDVKTRAHRRTTYDISVSVSSASEKSSLSASAQSLFELKNNSLCNLKKTNSVSMMAFNASSANFIQDKDEDRLTSIVSNKTSDSALVKQAYNLFVDKNSAVEHRFWNDDGSVESSVTAATCLRTPPRDTEEQSVLMKAFGSAFGGLLTRRSGASISTKPSHNKEYWQHASNAIPRRPVQHCVEDLRQPYHRVVTAPPGA